MKIRTGFVSNSSSSSYVLAVKKQQECECCGLSNSKMIELITLLLGKKEFNGRVPKSFTGNMTEYVESLDVEIEELEKDIVCGTEKIKLLEKISANNDALLLMDQWNNLSKIRNDRYMDESEYKQSSVDNLKWKIQNVESEVNRAKNSISEIRLKKQKLEAATNEDRRIFIFEMDDWDDARRIIEELIENDVVEVIEKVHH